MILSLSCEYLEFIQIDLSSIRPFSAKIKSIQLILYPFDFEGIFQYFVSPPPLKSSSLLIKFEYSIIELFISIVGCNLNDFSLMKAFGFFTRFLKMIRKTKIHIQ